ncbi:thioesterase (plasmid) [Rhodococcus oxybenzonivorans]|uniref:Thioesterase n=1 Tax=Rhodococcus oxybenzonivorans TaxID=1990687 RepID=A0A2S2C7B5_9NOCA|nr:thioesterase [Rhodococcus oxybenzonivorans]
MPKLTAASDQPTPTAPQRPGDLAGPTPTEDHRGDHEFGELLATFRELQAALSAAAPPIGLMGQLRRELRSATERLAEFRVPEQERYSQRNEMEGRGSPVLIPFAVEELSERYMAVGVEFTDAHLGGNAAVHGGIIPLLFDDLMGKFTRNNGQGVSRTAFLNVNYGKVTPLYRPLRAEVSIDRMEGRKTWITGGLLDGEELLADADALFVRLLPGQP